MELVEWNLTHFLLAVSTLLLTYMIVKWYQNPLRKIPGPPGLPILGNALSLDLTDMHNQMYEMAKEYGPVMKVYILNVPMVVLNTSDACLEALVRSGTDFQGRPPMKRISMILKKDLLQSNGTTQIFLRRVMVTAMKAYGPGVARLEKILQETTIELIDSIQQKNGEVIDAQKLTTGYLCSVLATMMFDEKYAIDDEICEKMHQINRNFLFAMDNLEAGVVLDIFPFLYDYKFLMRGTHKRLEKTIRDCNEFTDEKIRHAKQTFDANNKRGWLDHILEVQQKEVDKDGNPLLDDLSIKGSIMNLITAGLETSLSNISQAFLDLLHDTNLQKRLQAEIDSQFVPTHTITLQDKEKLPLLESYLLENLRSLSQVPFLVPHLTIRDTQVGGYKIPANTQVIFNAYRLAHDPDVYDEPFTLRPGRFLDKDGKVVDVGHPLRQNLLSFGAGRRRCPGELLAKSRIFLFLANILQKFDIEAVGELPDRDVRKYKLAMLIVPPAVSVRFIRRQ